MMSLDWITIARPYAKAVFEVGIEHQTLKAWSEILEQLAAIASQAEMVFFIKRPDISPEQLTEIFVEYANVKQNTVAVNFIQLLAQKGRLGALPAIQQLYDDLRAEYEKTMEANVTSFEAMTEQQQTILVAALKKRLKRDVHLNIQVDSSLLGGVIVNAGDFVIDGSIRGKLYRLNDEMMK